jgi:hypothetical protein
LGLRINPYSHKIRISRPREGVKSSKSSGPELRPAIIGGDGRKTARTWTVSPSPLGITLALGQQEMEVRVKVDPVAKGLDYNNDTGDKPLPLQRLNRAP